MNHDRTNLAFHIRGVARILDEIEREIEAAGIPALADIEGTRRRILALADQVEAAR